MWPVTIEKPRIKLCAVAMLDLLGYGVQLRAASGQLNHPCGALAIERIRSFHRTPMLLARPTNFHLTALNDAVVVVRDIDPFPELPQVTMNETFLNPLTLTTGGARQVWDFFEWTRDLHDEVKRLQRSNGYPGARTVLVVGERIDDPDEGPLNLNMAFAAAYLADRAGSAGGLAGDDLFIEWLVFILAAQLTRQQFDYDKDIDRRSVVSGVDILGRKRSFLRSTFVPADQPPGKGTYVSMQDDWRTKLPTEHGRLEPNNHSKDT